MTWQNRYSPPNPEVWQGRPDSPASSSYFQKISCVDLTKIDLSSLTKPAFALLGFCCDEGIRRNFGRVGAALAPPVFRENLASLPYRSPDATCYDIGDLTCDDGDLESAQNALGDVTALLLQQQITPIVMGGGHELAYGHFQGIAKHTEAQRIGIINFDAHFDMRPLLSEEKGSSGTSFLQIAQLCKELHRPFNYNCIGIQSAGNIQLLFDTAKQYEVRYMLADTLYTDRSDKGLNFIDRIIDTNDALYVSICLDVFAAPYAPGVSAPQSLGLLPWQILHLIRRLAASRKAISYDIAELSPPYDIDQRTAKLAANLLADIMHYHKPIKLAGKE